MPRLKTRRKYQRSIRKKGYDPVRLAEYFYELYVDLEAEEMIRLKSAIIFLSRTEEEIESLVDLANRDHEFVLHAAEVKAERG